MKKFLLAIIISFAISTVSWAYTTVSGDISGNTTWSSGTYYISTNVTGGNAYSLTINSGVVVKMASGVKLSGAPLVVNGTAANPVYLTSKNDDTVGDPITGSSHSPAAGDWLSVGDDKYPNSTPISMTYAVVRYSTNGINVDQNPNLTHIITNTIIKNCSVEAFNTGDNGGAGGMETINLSNSQVDTCVIGLSVVANLNATNVLFRNNTTYADYVRYSTHTFKNCTIDSNGTGVYTSTSGYATVANSVISNNGVNLYNSDSGTAGLSYVNQYNNTTTNAATVNTNPISGNPNYQTGLASTTYIGNMAYFLNQSTSPDISAGSASSSSLSMNTYTTSITASLDSGTVDVGYHYNTVDVYYMATSVNHGFTRFLK